MKTSLLIIIFFGFTRLLTAQPLTGTYVSTRDTTSVYIDSLHIENITYPNLRLDTNYTFQYNWNFPDQCMMGNTMGNWGIINDTLLLQDMRYTSIGPGYSRTREARGMLIINAYKIEYKKLTYLYTIHEMESQKSFQPGKPDLRFYKE